jgi:histidine triad (HIT) family protein
MDECLFCEIIEGHQVASLVYEDQGTLGFMNQRQGNPGHVLVIPKTHRETVFDLTPQEAGELFSAVVVVSRAVKRSLGAEGLTIWQSNDHVAGQEVPHVHIHVLPRREGDELVTFYPHQPPLIDRDELDRLASQIRRWVRG